MNTADTSHGLGAAIARGQRARVEWTQDGTLLTPEAFAKARGLDVAELDQAEVFPVVVEGQQFYPAELLKLEPAVAAAVCSALANCDDATKMVFLHRKHGSLGGKTVTEAVAEGQLAQVVVLAQT